MFLGASFAGEALLILFMLFFVLPPIAAILVFWAVLGRLWLDSCASAAALLPEPVGLAQRAL